MWISQCHSMVGRVLCEIVLTFRLPYFMTIQSYDGVKNQTAMGPVLAFMTITVFQSHVLSFAQTQSTYFHKNTFFPQVDPERYPSSSLIPSIENLNLLKDKGFLWRKLKEKMGTEAGRTWDQVWNFQEKEKYRKDTGFFHFSWKKQVNASRNAICLSFLFDCTRAKQVFSAFTFPYKVRDSVLNYTSGMFQKMSFKKKKKTPLKPFL